MTQPTFNGPTALVLRCCRADFTSYGGFQWPSEIGAQVIAPDWSDDTNCGHGLHGWLYGAGDHACSDYWSDKDSKWLVVEVEESSIRVIGGKCKFPRCIVRFIGTLTGGYSSTLTGGHYSTLTGGDSSTLTGGDGSELRFKYWDDKARRYRTKLAYVGEDGIEANVAYRLNEKNEVVRAAALEEDNGGRK